MTALIVWITNTPWQTIQLGYVYTQTNLTFFPHRFRCITQMHWNLRGNRTDNLTAFVDIVSVEKIIYKVSIAFYLHVTHWCLRSVSYIYQRHSGAPREQILQTKDLRIFQIMILIQLLCKNRYRYNVLEGSNAEARHAFTYIGYYTLKYNWFHLHC